MLAPWLLYASFLGAIFVAIGLLGERVLRWRGEAARWLWLAAIVMTVSAPLLLSVRSRAVVSVPMVAMPSVARAAQPTAAAASRPVVPPRNYDVPLLALWLLASSLVALRVAGTAVALRRRRRTWITANLGGHPVLLTDELGPAVIGWRRFTTVVPRWALSFDESSRALMLAHEAEHASSGDPYLRSAALFALVLMPWNPALWFATRRLRLAIEMDCDQRVLARGADPQKYASLLLAVGERMSATPFAWATALGGSRSQLERRIQAMTTQLLPRHHTLATAGIVVATVVAIATACATPTPDPLVSGVNRGAGLKQDGVPAPLVGSPAEFIVDTTEFVCQQGNECKDSFVHRIVSWRRRDTDGAAAPRVKRPIPAGDTIMSTCDAAHCGVETTYTRRNDTLLVYRNGEPQAMRFELGLQPDVQQTRTDRSGSPNVPMTDTLRVRPVDGKENRVYRGRQDDSDIGVDSAGRVVRVYYAAAGAHYCAAGDACATASLLARSLPFLLTHPTYDYVVVHDTATPHCTPAQAAAKHTKSPTGFYPLCVE